MREAGKGASVFRGGWKNICIYLLLPPSGPRRPNPLYRRRDSSISAPASPYSEVSPAEATFAPSLCFFHPRYSPAPAPIPVFPPSSSFISARAPLSFLSLLLPFSFPTTISSTSILLTLLLSVSLSVSLSRSNSLLSLSRWRNVHRKI